MLVDEKQMLAILESSPRVLLVEPPYRRKYMPLGLAKIASYVKAKGGKATFRRKTTRWAAFTKASYDLICVTSLFTWDSQIVVDEVNAQRKFYPGVPILVGGIYASLMAKNLEQRTAPDIHVFTGYSRVLDQCVPDYAEAWGLADPEWEECSDTFTSRGCPNRCPYCAVHKLEADPWINPTWRHHIVPSKPIAMISDNNLSATPAEHLNAVIRVLHDRKRLVIFDNGFDCKHVTDDMARMLANLKFTRSGMRLAFDRIEEDGVFQAAVERLKRAGVPKNQIMAYCLFNFNDRPKDADYRMRECAKLGIRPYPQQFTPLNRTDRVNPYIGPKWTKGLAHAFRFFWLMAGTYSKWEFEAWAKAKPDAAKMSAEDWAAWHGDSHRKVNNEP